MIGILYAMQYPTAQERLPLGGHLVCELCNIKIEVTIEDLCHEMTTGRWPEKIRSSCCSHEMSLTPRKEPT